MLKRIPPTYALALESKVAVGSLHASAVCWSLSTNCQNGGIWSPHVLPPSNDQSYPQWLKPIRESFCPATRFDSFVGLIATTSSACRRSEQSWLTRTLAMLPLTKRFWQPCVPVVLGPEACTLFAPAVTFSVRWPD